MAEENHQDPAHGPSLGAAGRLRDRCDPGDGGGGAGAMRVRLRCAQPAAEVQGGAGWSGESWGAMA